MAETLCIAITATLILYWSEAFFRWIANHPHDPVDLVREDPLEEYL